MSAKKDMVFLYIVLGFMKCAARAILDIIMEKCRIKSDHLSYNGRKHMETRKSEIALKDRIAEMVSPSLELNI